MMTTTQTVGMDADRTVYLLSLAIHVHLKEQVVVGSNVEMGSTPL